MRRQPATFRLSDEEMKTLQGWLRQGKAEQRMVERARIILLAHEGRTNQQIADQLHTRTARVSKWRQRFGAQRLLGLSDALRSGKPARYDKPTEKKVLALLDQSPPRGYSQWNGNRLAAALPDISRHQIWRILRRHDICLQRRRSWCISTDPEFGPKAADVVGLYLNPPQNALVLSVDEKPSIQALERAQGYLRLPDGKAVNGFSHGYKRHGTTTLFAALENHNRAGEDGTLSTSPPARVLGLYERDRSRPPAPRDSCGLGQSQHAQAQRRPLVERPPQGAFPLHTNLFIVAQSGGMLVQHPQSTGAPRSQFYIASTTPASDRPLCGSLQRKSRTV
jgi:transposase